MPDKPLVCYPLNCSPADNYLFKVNIYDTDLGQVQILLKQYNNNCIHNNDPEILQNPKTP